MIPASAEGVPSAGEEAIFGEILRSEIAGAARAATFNRD